MVMVPRKRPAKPVKRTAPGPVTAVPKRRVPAAQRKRSNGRSGAARAQRAPRGARLRGGRRGLHVLLAAYLAGACVVLAVVFLAFPHRSDGPPAPGGRTWDYQLETVALQGPGALNAYARGATRATAWLARGSIERQRDVHRLNLLEYLAGEPAAAASTRWVDRHRLALEGGTIALLVGVAAYGLLRRPAGREWLVAILVLLALTAVVTRPLSASRLAGRAGVAVPNLVLAAAVQGDPTQELRGGSQQVQEALASRYWTAFVAEPLSRLQTGTGVLSNAPPARKAGILGYLRGKVSAVNDWAIGRHGVERSVISTLAVVYVLPFALLLCTLAMLATCAQALLYLLCLAGPVAAALAVEPRWRRGVLRLWLAPLGGALLVLSVAALASFMVVRGAELLHASDDYAGLLLAGSAWPLLGGALLARRMVRRRRATRRRPIVVRGGAA
jgi:hypothetical protein